MVDTTRYPLATNMEGLLLILGAGTKESKELLEELKKEGSALANMQVGLKSLAEAYPQDRMIREKYFAVEKLRTRSYVNVTAIQQLKTFVNHARKQ